MSNMSGHGTGVCSFLLLMVLFLTVPNFNQAASIKDIKALSDRLMVNYSKYILPSESEDPFNVTIGVLLEAMGNIDEIDEKLSTVLWIHYFWTDESIKWDREKENNTYITLGWVDVWKPVLQLANPQTDSVSKPNCDRSFDTVIYGYDGSAYYDEMMTVRTSCDLDMSYYPFDVQECYIKLRIFGHSKFLFNLSVVPLVDISKDDAEHGSWTLERFNTSSTSNNGEFVLNLKFKRHPLFLLLNIIMPLFILALLTPIVFILPKKSGERVGYAVAMLLSISVYMTIVSEHIPHNSKPVPLLSVMIFMWYSFDAAVVLVVIINTQINLTRKNKRMPKVLRWFVMFNRKCHRNTKDTNETSSEEIQKCIEMKGVQDNEDVKNGQGKTEELSEHFFSQDVTWQELSRCIDKWFFFASYVLKISLPVTFLTVMGAKTHNQ